MPKYTKEFKIKLVLEYLSGQSGGYKSVAKKHNIPWDTLRGWVIKYKSGGFDKLSKKLKNNKFTSEFKLSVIQYRQINDTSLRETAEHFNLVNGSMVYRWETAYQERGLSGLEDNRGRPNKDMSKSNKKSKLNTPINESEREELIRLREENRFLKMKIIYEKSYKPCYWKREQKQGKDKEVKDEIKTIVEESRGRYGYRRVTMVLKNKGFNINHKRVLRIMREESLLCSKLKTRSRKYSSYKGQIGKVADNIVSRQFKASKPNQLWLTDVTEFRIKGKEEKLYLSPILDLYNSEIISDTLSHHPTIKLTNKMLEKALDKNQDIKNLTIHSDQGFHYQHNSWTAMLEKMNIRQSMSRKGNCLDNSPMENFFGILKQEMYYGEDFKNYDELVNEIEKYIKWYNEDRIKTKLNGMSPVMYRLHSA